MVMVGMHHVSYLIESYDDYMTWRFIYSLSRIVYFYQYDMLSTFYLCIIEDTFIYSFMTWWCFLIHIIQYMIYSLFGIT